MSVVDRITWWKNQQILDALEALEDRTYLLSEVKSFGRMDEYENGIQEFYWKGELAIIFFPPEPDDLSMLSLECVHVYNDKKVNIQQHNK